jgi:hypothetical protein
MIREIVSEIKKKFLRQNTLNKSAGKVTTPINQTYAKAF